MCHLIFTQKSKPTVGQVFGTWTVLMGHFHNAVMSRLLFPVVVTSYAHTWRKEEKPQLAFHLEKSAGESY